MVEILMADFFSLSLYIRFAYKFHALIAPEGQNCVLLKQLQSYCEFFYYIPTHIFFKWRLTKYVNNAFLFLFEHIIYAVCFIN